MKTRQLMMLTLLLLCVLPGEAQAFYNPNAGSWLSRESVPGKCIC
ncbi:MAG: hypothetical protein V9H26_16505 [Verrucomicrobiota bacterium]